MKPSIVLKNIEFSYPNEDNILSIADFCIKEGEKVFIYGPSGCGKSTLLNLIAGVVAPSSGSIVVMGKKYEDLSAGEKDSFRGDNIGFVFQHFNLIPYLTIYENILLPLKTSKQRYLNVNSNLEAEVKRVTTHLKIENFLNKRVTHLSIGQQQRVAVARALIGDPEIVIADEPTSSLDESVTKNFMSLLMQEHLEKRFTLIFVSHDKHLAEYFDRKISLMDINKATLRNA